MMRRMLVTAMMLMTAAAPARLLSQAPAQAPPAPLDPRVLEWDKGPTKIDVSKYPDQEKANYKVFAERCSKCHTLARPINSPFVLEDEWERYIKKMMRRAAGGITPDDAQKIFEFVTYDAKIRKKALYEQKLAGNK